MVLGATKSQCAMLNRLPQICIHARRMTNLRDNKWSGMGRAESELATDRSSVVGTILAETDQS